jgi:tRNA G10  N-methylase Trm11
MRPIHPFPARMAPETVARWLRDIPAGSRVLDPMCGSGVVLRHSSQIGHRSIGFDIDPLAVLMSRVWTRNGGHESLRTYASDTVARARRRRASHIALPWVRDCPETRSFIEYWFAEPQRSELSRLALAIMDGAADNPRWVTDALRLGLSRIVVTKQAGASLAWDASHSRPHRKIKDNPFDTYEQFERSVERLANILDETPVRTPATVHNSDCRHLSRLQDGSVDAIVTSPPYLNAIDYLRGHRLSLVWMGHTVPALRDIRARSVGTERAGRSELRTSSCASQEFLDVIPAVRRLPDRQRAIVRRYTIDADLIISELRRVLSDTGRMVLVLADSRVRGVRVPNSKIFAQIAAQHRFRLVVEERRAIPRDRRYLPIDTGSNTLEKRMREEVVQVYLPVA